VAALTLLLHAREEDSEEEEGGGGGAAAAAAWAAFPWPPGAAPPPWRGSGALGRARPNCAAVPVVLASLGDFSEGVEAPLRLSVYLHPAALARWQGVAPLAHATLVPLTALLRVPPAATRA
jgi:hypothetical protein